ncbi:ATP-binding protein [Azohydromonas aeria]|uniref:ATP-binding protein n=1 Tax=Azohydromonas aeria TaxID=2590212 RepID=UPI0012FA4CDA|nr:AAA family ATPase [Azohydromonas aeria]
MHDEDDALRLRFEAFELDEGQARLTRAGQPLALPPKAFGVLCTLARQPGRLVAKEALLDAVWGHRWVSDSVLKTTISELRAALGDDARQPRYIETASRRGYRFIGVVQAPGVAPEPPAAAAIPMPAATGPDAEAPPPAAPAAPLIGRHAALARLQAAWRQAGAGRRQIVWLTGEAGIGKTTLIEHFMAGLGAGAACAHGQCVEQYGAGEPYLPVLEALGALCRNEPELPALLRTVAPTWLLQLPWLLPDTAAREALRQELAGVGQQRMLRELGELLDRCTAQRPLLLVTEDLHWSDQATVQLIDHVARRRGPARLMWLASLRLAEVIAEEHPLKALRHELKLHRLCEEILLDPFSEREVADFIGQRCPSRTPSEAFVRALHGRTDGLPLFLVNVVDELEAQGPACAEAATAAVPESLAGVIEKQIARLSGEDCALLEAASVCGTEFRPATVSAALEREAGGIAGRCESLARQQQWLSHVALDSLADGSLQARYGFRHALYRQVFHQRIGAATRAQLHRRVARALEADRAAGAAVTAAELASHCELGHDIPAALRHYAAAAESALQHFAPGEAMALTAQALALLPRCPAGVDRNGLEMALLGPRGTAAAQLLGVAAPETVATFERAQELAGQLPALTSRALELGAGWAYLARGQYEQALALATRIGALAALRGERLLHVSACNLQATVVSFQGDLAGARRWLEEGLQIFSELADPAHDPAFIVDLGVSMHARMALVLSHLGFPDQAWAEAERALARADRVNQPLARVLALAFTGMLALRLEEVPRVQALGEALQQLVTEHAVAEGEGPARWLRGWALAHQGQPQDGYALIVDGYQRAFSLGRIGAGLAAALGAAADAAALCGRWDDAQARLDEALALARRVGDRILLPDLRLLQARIAHGCGNGAAALASLREALLEARAQQAGWSELAALVGLCASGAAQSQEIEMLAQLRARCAEGADTVLMQRVNEVLGALAARRRGPAA